MAGLPSRAGQLLLARISSASGHLGSLLLDVVADILRLDVAQTRCSPALVVARVGRAVVHRRLGPSSSATTSTACRALPSSAVQLRCCSRPTTTTRLPFERDCAACSAWSRHTITVKNDASCSRRPDTATRTWPGRSRLGVADLGVVGEVAGKAHAGLGHDAALLNAWPGGLPCPWNRGTVNTVACQQSPRGKRRSQRSRPVLDQVAERARLRCRVGWWGACGWGSGMSAPVRPDPSTLGVAGARGSHQEDCSQPSKAQLISRTWP